MQLSKEQNTAQRDTVSLYGEENMVCVDLIIMVPDFLSTHDNSFSVIKLQHNSLVVILEGISLHCMR